MSKTKYHKVSKGDLILIKKRLFIVSSGEERAEFILVEVTNPSKKLSRLIKEGIKL
jgi:hypothetical protein